MIRPSGELSVSLIGVGSIGRTIHLPLLASTPGLRLKTLIDPYLAESDLDKLAKQWSCSWSRRVSDCAADLAVIATPISSHLAVAAEALEAGCHVLVEKPLGGVYVESLDLLDSASEHGLRVFCGQVRRLYPSVQLARRAFESGIPAGLSSVELYEGNLSAGVRSYYTEDRTRDIAVDEGVLFDVGTHSIDTLRFILGDSLSEMTVEESVCDDLRLPANVDIRGEIVVDGQRLPWRCALSNTVALANCIWLRGSRSAVMIPAVPANPRVITADGEACSLVPDGVGADAFLQQLLTVTEAIRSGERSVLDGSAVVGTVEVLERAWAAAEVGTCDWMGVLPA